MRSLSAAASSLQLNSAHRCRWYQHNGLSPEVITGTFTLCVVVKCLSPMCYTTSSIDGLEPSPVDCPGEGIHTLAAASFLAIKPLLLMGYKLIKK